MREVSTDSSNSARQAMGERLQSLEAKLDSFSSAVMRIVPEAAVDAAATARPASERVAQEGDSKLGGATSSTRSLPPASLPAGQEALGAVRTRASHQSFHDDAVSQPVAQSQPLMAFQPISHDILHRLHVARETLRHQVSCRPLVLARPRACCRNCVNTHACKGSHVH